MTIWRGVMHRGVLDWTRVNMSTALSCDRDEHVAMPENVVLSQESEIPPAIVTTTEREENSSVRSTLEEQRE